MEKVQKTQEIVVSEIIDEIVKLGNLVYINYFKKDDNENAKITVVCGEKNVNSDHNLNLLLSMLGEILEFNNDKLEVSLVSVKDMFSGMKKNDECSFLNADSVFYDKDNKKSCSLYIFACGIADHTIKNNRTPKRN